MLNVWDEETPDDLQKKFYLIASVELAWRGGEGAMCSIKYFKEETNSDGIQTGRIEYNPVFTKTTQGGTSKCADSKWLIENKVNPDFCPVRLYRKLISKRSNNVKTDRLFLTVNPSWKSSFWYKNMPIGRNNIQQWINDNAQRAGLNTKNRKITNHSSRATAVSSLAKAGVSDQQLIKISGHSSSHSIKPYLQLDKDHHETLINQMRETNNVDDSSLNLTTAKQVVYNNCTFNCTNLYMN